MTYTPICFLKGLKVACDIKKKGYRFWLFLSHIGSEKDVQRLRRGGLDPCLAGWSCEFWPDSHFSWLLPLHWPMWLTRTSVLSATLRSRQWLLSRLLRRQDWKCPMWVRWGQKDLVESRVLGSSAGSVPGNAQPQASPVQAGAHIKISGLWAGVEMAEAGKGNRFWPEKTCSWFLPVSPQSLRACIQVHMCPQTVVLVLTMVLWC